MVIVVGPVVFGPTGLALSSRTGGVVAVVAELAPVRGTRGVGALDGAIGLAIRDGLVGRVVETHEVASEPGPRVREVDGERNTKRRGSQEEGCVVLGGSGVLNDGEEVGWVC